MFFEEFVVEEILVVVVFEFVSEGELFFMIMFSGWFVLVFVGGEGVFCICSGMFLL